MSSYVFCFIHCYKPTLIYWRFIMKKFLIGAAIGGAVAYWAHCKTLKIMDSVAKTNSNLFDGDKVKAAEGRRAAMHVVK
jgi:hypothetical protein